MKPRRPRKPLTTAEISDRYRVHQRTVIRWIREFGLPATRAGGRWRVEEADLEQFLTESRLQATGPVYVLVEVDGAPTIGRLMDYAPPGSPPVSAPVSLPVPPLAAATMSVTTS
jgi:excisionase family DNA binding protein